VALNAAEVCGVAHVSSLPPAPNRRHPRLHRTACGFPAEPGSVATDGPAAIPITIALGAVQLVFAYTIVVTLRAKGVNRAVRSGARPRRRMSNAAAEALIVLLAISLAIPAGVVGWVVGRYAGAPRTRTVTVSAARPTVSTTSPISTTDAADDDCRVGNWRAAIPPRARACSRAPAAPAATP